MSSDNGRAPQRRRSTTHATPAPPAAKTRPSAAASTGGGPMVVRARTATPTGGSHGYTAVTTTIATPRQNDQPILSTSGRAHRSPTAVPALAQARCATPPSSSTDGG